MDTFQTPKTHRELVNTSLFSPKPQATSTVERKSYHKCGQNYAKQKPADPSKSLEIFKEGDISDFSVYSSTESNIFKAPSTAVMPNPIEKLQQQRLLVEKTLNKASLQSARRSEICNTSGLPSFLIKPDNKEITSVPATPTMSELSLNFSSSSCNNDNLVTKENASELNSETLDNCQEKNIDFPNSAINDSVASEEFIPGELAAGKIKADEESWFRSRGLPVPNTNLTLSSSFVDGTKEDQSIGAFFREKCTRLSEISWGINKNDTETLENFTINSNESDSELNNESSIQNDSDTIRLSMIANALKEDRSISAFIETLLNKNKNPKQVYTEQDIENLSHFIKEKHLQINNNSEEQIIDESSNSTLTSEHKDDSKLSKILKIDVDQLNICTQCSKHITIPIQSLENKWYFLRVKTKEIRLHNGPMLNDESILNLDIPKSSMFIDPNKKVDFKIKVVVCTACKLNISLEFSLEDIETKVITSITHHLIINAEDPKIFFPNLENGIIELDRTENVVTVINESNAEVDLVFAIEQTYLYLSFQQEKNNSVKMLKKILPQEKLELVIVKNNIDKDPSNVYSSKLLVHQDAYQKPILLKEIKLSTEENDVFKRPLPLRKKKSQSPLSWCFGKQALSPPELVSRSSSRSSYTTAESLSPKSSQYNLNSAASSQYSSTSSLSKPYKEKSTLEASKTELVWGCVKIGKSVQSDIVIRNRSPRRVKFNIQITGNFKFQQLENGSNISLHGNESRTLTVIFTSNHIGAETGKICFKPLEGTDKKVIRLYAYGGHINLEYGGVARDAHGSAWLSLGVINNAMYLEKAFHIKNNGNLPAFAHLKLTFKDLTFIEDSKLSVSPKCMVLQPGQERKVFIYYRPKLEDLKKLFNSNDVNQLASLDITTGAEPTKFRLRRLINEVKLKNQTYSNLKDILDSYYPDEQVLTDIHLCKENKNSISMLIENLESRSIGLTIEKNLEFSQIIMEGEDESCMFHTILGDQTTFVDHSSTMNQTERNRVESDGCLYVEPNTIVVGRTPKKIFIVSRYTRVIRFHIESVPMLLISPAFGNISPHSSISIDVSLKPEFEQTLQDTTIYIYSENQVIQLPVKIERAAFQRR